MVVSIYIIFIKENISGKENEKMIYSATYEKSKKEVESYVRNLYKHSNKIEEKEICVNVVHGLKNNYRSYFYKIGNLYITYDISDTKIFENKKKKMIEELERQIYEIKESINSLKEKIENR